MSRFQLIAPAYRAKRGLTLQRERAQDVLPEMLPLLHEHKEEIAHYADIPLDVDEQRYINTDLMGLLRCYTARMGGDLIGYAVFFVQPNAHYKSSLQAVQDVLFVTKPHRHSRAGYALIRHSEEALRAEGVAVCYHHIKVSTPQTIELFKRLGYEPIDLILGKRLDR